MERLTNHFDYCKMIDCKFYDPELFKQGKCKFFDIGIQHCHEKRMNDRLREYEDAEEQGVLARLPCKIGDVLYYRSRCVIKELIVMEMRIRKHCTDVFTEDIEGEKYAFSSEVIGKTVFLTREEAALAEMEK